MINMKYIRKMREEASKAVTDFNADNLNKRLLKSAKKGDQPGYKATTFLYIRAFEGDSGIRPIPDGIPFWFSPAIELFDSFGVHILTTEIKTKNDYNVQVTVSNDGDQECNSCIVELYLDDPLIGFSVNASKLIGAQTVEVIGHSNTVITFPFKATTEMAGHKCMFARAYSIMSNDYPVDFNNFLTAEDRHIGQQNLDILQQGTVFEFNFNSGIVAKNHDYSINLQADRNLVKKMKLPALSKYLVTEKSVDTSVFKFNLIAKTPKKTAVPAVTGANIPRRVISHSRRIEALKVIAPQSLASLKKDVWAHKFDTGISKLQLVIPSLGLHPNEAIPMNISITDTKTGKVLGGIALVIVG